MQLRGDHFTRPARLNRGVAERFRPAIFNTQFFNQQIQYFPDKRFR